jgi:glutamine amidotransferase
MKQNVVIIDYGMGNIGSIVNMFNFLGIRPIVSNDEQVIKGADKVVLPGVGNFDKAMNNINRLNLKESIYYLAIEKQKPFLGICLGMQIMCENSEEGTLPGLSLIQAVVKKFSFAKDSGLKIPHMGWNEIQTQKDSKILEQESNSRFYFVHSFFVSCKKNLDVSALTEYGYTFVSAFERENLMGVQFHPEKSHRFGTQLFKNYLAI